MIRAFVDRIETDERGEPLAVLLVELDEGDYLHWLCPLAWLPPDTREGSWLRVVVHRPTSRDPSRDAQ
jgi:hypothetical protein